jgi:hypothetical protein
MGPHHLLRNVVQSCIQRALQCNDTRLSEGKLNEPAESALDRMDGFSDEVQGAIWIAVADAPHNTSGAIRSAVQRYLERTTNISKPASTLAIDPWLKELRAVVSALRQNPCKLPRSTFTDASVVNEHPTGLLISDDTVLEALESSDPSIRLRACFRFLSNPQFAQSHRAALETRMQSESVQAIRTICYRILQELG